MDSLFSLEDRVVIITGGLGHLGRGMVKAAAAHGATVVVPYHLTPTTEHLEGLPAQQLHVLPCDLSDTPSITRFFAAAWEQFGRLDALVNNAAYGGGVGGKTLNNAVLPDDEAWAAGLDGALSVTFRCIREAVPFFRQQNGGSIVNIASMYGHIAPDPGLYGDTGFDSPAMYGAGKAATLQLTRYYASNLAADNIRVNAITPGAFPQASVRHHEAFYERLKAKTMLGRTGQPEDLAGALLLLISDASSYMTGTNITVDGGWTAW